MLRICLKGLLALGVAILSFASAVAVPAYPGKIKAVQPDGTEIEIVLQGDEHFNWARTTDGYTLLRDENNYWALACQDANGMLVASKHIFRNDTRVAVEAGIERGLYFSQAQLDAVSEKKSAMRRANNNSGLQVDGTFPGKGENKLLLLMLNYSDTEPTYTPDDFEKMMNEQNYGGIGSFRDFYLENSYGQLDITTVVTRWVTLPYTKDYYGSERAIEMIQNGLNIIKDEIDLSEFDNNGDGILDGLAVIHQGTGQEYSGAANEIWSHSNIIYGMSFDGIQIRRYTIEPELLNRNGDMATIGVICHEFGHNLGAPDFYDADYYESNGYYAGTGIWDLMSSGAWNGNNGDRPAGINMWQKIQCGWVTPTLLNSTQHITDMKPAHNNPIAYRFDTTVPGEYYILENRQQAGAFDVALPGHGLLVYHANDAKIKASVANNLVNASYPQAMYLVCASAGEDPNEFSTSYGDVNSTSAPFPGTANITAFSDATLPSTRSISGRYTYKSLTDISESNDGIISFDFTCEKTPLAPINLEAHNEKGRIVLSWQMPAEAAGVTRFNIYRDNTHLATTNECVYIDDKLENADYITYYVDAEYDNGLVSPYTSVSTRVPANFVTAVEAVVNDGNVALTWDVESKLTRMTNVAAEFAYLDYNMTSLDYVHRFRVEDLQMYKGYKIKKIAYLPYQAQKDLTLTLRVWEADADGSNPKVISERLVKEFGTAVWNTTLLTKSVEITGEKELWIGLHCESTTGTIRLLTDKGPVVEEYGNWVKLENDEWTADSYVMGNFFLYAPLSEPERGEVNEIADGGVMTNPYLDMLFPTGYAIYRDNELLAYTDSRNYIDNEPLSGKHVYGVASLYRGNNESESIAIEVDYVHSGIENVHSHTKLHMVVANGTLTLPSYHGYLLVADVMGHIVYEGSYAEGETVMLPAGGIYIVKTTAGIEKLVVR